LATISPPPGFSTVQLAHRRPQVRAVVVMQQLTAPDPLQRAGRKRQVDHRAEHALHVQAPVLTPPVRGRQALHLVDVDVQRDRPQAALGELRARPARVRADVEDPVALLEVDGRQHLVHQRALREPVAAVLVGQPQHPLAVPAVGAHDVGEAVQAGLLAQHALRRAGQQVDDPALDRAPLAALPAGQLARAHLVVVLDGDAEAQALIGLAARAAQHAQQVGPHLHLTLQRAIRPKRRGSSLDPYIRDRFVM